MAKHKIDKKNTIAMSGYWNNEKMAIEVFGELHFLKELMKDLDKCEVKINVNKVDQIAGE